MTNEEILTKLKENLDENYSFEEFTGKEINNLESFINNAKDVSNMNSLYRNEMLDNLNAYTEFIKYLAEEAIGDIKPLIECFYGNDSNRFIGYLETNKEIHENKIYLLFNIDNINYKAEWQPSDNYAVWQTCGVCGDDYSGYLLFPTYNQNKYFCISYTC